MFQCLGLRLATGFLSILILAPLWGWLGIRAAVWLSGPLRPALLQAEWLLPGIGAAGIIKLFAERGGGRFVLAGFAVTALLGLAGVPGWMALVASLVCAFGLVAEPFQRLRMVLAKGRRRMGQA
jgi:hypothetical protein